MKSIRNFIVLAALSACRTVPAPAPDAAGGASFDLVVLGTTDIHGRIRGWDYYADSAEAGRGLTRAATVVDSIRAANPGRVLLLDAGDLLQGNPFAYVAMKQDSVTQIIAAMNALRYDAMAIGNHEYNYGVPYLERAVSQATFPLLSANTYKPDGSHKFRPWTIVERQGVRVGIIGATTPGVMIWDAENVRGRVRLGDIVDAVRKAAGEVGAAGADVVIVTVHAGLDEPASYDTAATGLPGENVSGRIAKDIPGIDLIVYGHSHKEQKGLHIGQTLLVQPRNWATSVGVARLTLSRTNSGWKVATSRGETIPVRGRTEHPAILAASAATHRATVTYANTVIGTTPVTWRGDSARLKDTPIIDLILDVQMKATGADLSSTAAFTLDAKLDSGEITVAEMAQLYPYDNTLRAIRITGRQLKDYLEYSSRFYTGVANGRPTVDPQVPGYNFDIVAGATYALDLTKPIGSRVTSLMVKGRPVSDTDTFTLALNNYRQSGGGGFSMIKDAPVVYDKQEEIRQLLIDEVQKRKNIRPGDFFTQNWSLSYPGAATGGAGGGLTSSGARLRIIATNDFHGALEPKADANGVQRGGAAHVASMIEKARRDCPRPCETILLDGGDLFQGTPISNFAFGRPVLDYYNRMGYTAAAVGNHEFDWGQDTLRARMRQARYAILGANVRDTDGRDVPWIRNDTLVEVNGVRVGVVGVATVETPRTTLAAHVSDLRFVDPVPVVLEHARSLRERGAHLVVVVAHAGAFCDDEGDDRCRGEIVELARGVGRAVDVIVSGHTHSLVRTLDPGVPIVQARSNGRAVGVVDLVPGELPVVSVRDVLPDSVAPLARIDSIARRAVAAVASRVSARVAEIPAHLQRSGEQYPLGHLVADAQRWAGKADIAVMNNGGIRADLPAGTATYGRVFEVQPFANTLHRFTLRGRDLRAYLEKIVGGRTPPRVHVSGVTLSYDPQRAAGQRIVSARLADGREIVDDAQYTLVMNNFMASGGDGLALEDEALHSEPLPIIDLDALIAYLKQLPQPVQAPTERRIVQVGS